MMVMIMMINLYLVDSYRQMLKIHTKKYLQLSYKETRNDPKTKKCMLLAVFTYLTNGLELTLLI